MRDLGETVKVGRPVPSLAEYYRGGSASTPSRAPAFMLHRPRVRHARPDRRGRERDAARPLLPRAHLRTPRHGAHRPPPIRPGRVAPRHRLRAALRRSQAGHRLRGHHGGWRRHLLHRRETWPATSRPCSAAAPTSTARCSSLRRSRRCSSRTTSRILASRASGLGVLPHEVGGHLAVEHDGILPGFDSQIFLAPDDGVGVMAFTNGARRGMHWLAPEVAGLLRQVLGVPDEAIRTDVPHHPEIWGDLCGWYRFSAMRERSGQVGYRRRGRGLRPARPADASRPEPDPRAVPRASSSTPTTTGRPLRLPDRASLVRNRHGPRRLQPRSRAGDDRGPPRLRTAVVPEATRHGRTPDLWVTGALGALAAATAATAVRRRRGRQRGATA